MGDQIERPADLAPDGRIANQRIPDVSVARADHGEIDSQQKDRGPHRLRPRHQVLGVPAVAHHVELKPGRSGEGLRDLLDAADRDRRFHERQPFRFRGAGGLHLRASREHAAQANGRQDDRIRQALTEDLR